MKKRAIQMVALLICFGNLQAQFSCPPYEDSMACELGNGISTDPDNLINKSCPDLKNDFEWRIQYPTNPQFLNYYRIFSSPTRNYPTGRVSIINPFTGPTDTEYFGPITAGDASNYNPKDGWELLSMNFGTLGNIGLDSTNEVMPNPNAAAPLIPYFILYNKYNGTLRFFGSLIDYENWFSTIKIEIKIPKSGEYQVSDLRATNLLSAQGDAVQPLDQESDETSISVFAQYPNNSRVFFWFDLPVVYDPCICGGKSQLEFRFQQMYSTSIAVNGDPMQGVTDFQGPAKKFYRGVLAAASTESEVGSLDQEIIASNMVTNLRSLDIFITSAMASGKHSDEEKKVLSMLQEQLSCNADLQNVSDRTVSSRNLQSYIQAEKALDANVSFTTLGISRCDAEGAGTVVTNYQTVGGKYRRSDYIWNEAIRLAIPGSNWSDTRLQSNVYVGNNGKTIPSYPTYNERLGTFALLETPVFKYEEEKINGSRYLAKLTQSANFSYSFNPIMNLNLDETKMYCRLAYSGEDVFDQKNGIHFEHNPEAKYKLTTPFVPMEHFKNMPLVAETYEQLDPKHLFIQFKIYTVSNNLASDGNPNGSYLFYTFPIKLDRKSTRVLSSSGGLIDDDFIHLQASDKIFDKPTYFAKNETLAYDGKVYISANMEVEEDKQVVIYATAGFEIAPEAELSKGLSLRRGYPFKIENQPPVSYEYLNTFCSDKQRYRAHHFAKRNSEQQQEISNERKFTIYPNPNEGVFYINFDQAITTEEELVMYSIDGKRVHTKILRPYSGKSYTVELSGLAKGLYLVKVLGNTELTAKRVLVF